MLRALAEARSHLPRWLQRGVLESLKKVAQPSSTNVGTTGKQVATNVSVTPPPASDVSQVSTVSIKSDPAGAEITIDGKFVGTTPSSVQIQPGERTITIEKVGFKSWLKTMSVTAGGSVSLDATLDKLP